MVLRGGATEQSGCEERVPWNPRLLLHLHFQCGSVGGSTDDGSADTESHLVPARFGVEGLECITKYLEFTPLEDA